MKNSLIHSVIIFLILMALTFSTVGVTPAYAATFTVTTTSNNGAGSLRQALADAPSGSTITFDASLSGTTIYLAAPLDIVKNVTIDGSMLALKITISGDSNGNGSGDVAVFTNSVGTLSDSVKIDSLIITHGFSYGDLDLGGGIYNIGFLTLRNSILDSNFANIHGGAIYNSGTLTVTNCTFSNNLTTSGGGSIYNDGTLTVTSSTFSGNATAYDSNGIASSGGGIYNSGILSVTNSTLSGNSATKYGGGIFNTDVGTVRVSNSTINNNTSDVSAGGIYNVGNLVLINSTLRGNLANLNGGAMFNSVFGVANIYNSTIVFNAADWDADINGGQAGGIYNSGGVFNLINSLVAGNSVSGAPIYDDCYGTLSSYGGNLIGAASESPSGASCTINFVGGSWQNLNDLNLLGPLQNNGGPTATIALLPGNNAIDHGNSVLGCVNDSYGLLATDQRGLPRVAGAWCDIGAYEFNDYTSPTVSSIVRVNSNPTSAVNVAFTVNFSESVTGVDISDFSLLTLGGVSGYFISGISGSGGVYTVTVNTGSGNGTIKLGVTDNDSIIDSLGNPLGGAGAGNGNFAGGEIYTINKPFAPASRWTSSFDLSHGWTVSQFVRTVGDVNNDGRDDLIGFGLDGVYVALSNGSGFGAVSKWSSSFDLSHGWTVADFVRTVGDVNNDGRDDLVGFGLDGVYVALSNGTSFDPISKWSSSFDLSHGWTVSQFVRTVGDVNNDGRDDLIGFGLDGVYVALSNGTSFGSISKWSSSFDLSHGWTVSQFVRTVGDVNNDGRDDLIGFGLDGVYVALSNGNGFGAVSKWSSSFDLSHGWTVSQFVRTVGDVNNDGRDDLIGFGQDGVYVALSNGASFDAVSRWTNDFDLSHGWTVSQYVRTVGDVNADGKADLVGFGLDGVYIGTAK